MGRGYEDVRDELAPPALRGHPEAEVVSIRIGDREVTPPEVSAHVLRALKQRAEALFGEPVEQAVITVPAYFNDAQRQATKDAGRIAGLDVLRIVNEPTAASLAYGLQKLAQGLIAVYDLGGGTFDISILRVQGRRLRGARHQRQHASGRRRLRPGDGGLAARRHPGRHGVDLAGDPEALQELRLGAEAAKCRLSFDERTVLTIPFDGFTYHRDITRAELEALVAPLVEATLGPCRMALEDAGLAARAGRRGRAGGRLHADAAGAAAGAGALRARRRTASSIPTRWWPWGPRSRRRSWPAASPTCCCST